VGGPTLAGPYAKAKKAELVQACERIFAGNFIAEAGTKQAALAWVPEAMRFAGSSGAAPGGAAGGQLPAEDEAADGDEPVVEEIEEAA
jgi:ParB family chromosome partitioning protein